MRELEGRTIPSVWSRICWFFILPHAAVIAILIAAAFYWVTTLIDPTQTRTPESEFEGMLHLQMGITLGLPTLAMALIIFALVGTLSFTLSFVRWRTRTVAFFAGIAFLLVGNVFFGAIAVYNSFLFQ